MRSCVFFSKGEGAYRVEAEEEEGEWVGFFLEVISSNLSSDVG